MTLYLTGARKGEIQGLTWNDIDFDKSLITITRQWNNKANEISEPKTVSSIRQVFIPKTLIKALNGLKNKQNGNANDYVFGKNKHFSATQIDRVKTQACLMANMPRFTNHILRHSYASLLINLNADITIVAELLGHSDIEQTLNTYAHMLPNRQRQTIYKLEKRIKSDLH